MNFKDAVRLLNPRRARHCLELLSPYIDRELDARRHARVEAHLAKCAECRAEYEEIVFGDLLASKLYLPEGMPTPFPRWLNQGGHVQRGAASWRRWGSAVAALVLLLALSVGAAWYYWHPRGDAWEVTRLSGDPVVSARHLGGGAGRMEVGDWLETDGFSRALIKVGMIGHVEVDVRSRVRLLGSSPGDHRLSLERGRMHATIVAPPRLFFVETPSSVAVDYGCAYTLEVDEMGESLLHVTAGWVGLTLGGRESLVPAGAMCRSVPGKGPGTPFLDDATPALREALGKFDFSGGGDEALRAVLAEARPKDSLTLWHLLSRTEGAGRVLTFERLAALVPPPEGVTRAGVLQLDEQMLARWRERIEYASVGVDYNTSPTANGTLRFAGVMNDARFTHAATLLSDGRVLITGGLERMGVPLLSAEIYDAASGAFTRVGDMTARRVGHTATLLENGGVLLTGGSQDTFFRGALRSTELYDPVTRTFAPGGDMGTPRLAHSATLLPGGKVLITGGQDALGRKLASAEVYDPASGAFSPVGSMGTPRSDHAATLLRDGRVLITGGAINSGEVEDPVASAELYDPATGAFAPTGAMHSVRFKHSATLMPDGRVIVIGGSNVHMWGGRYATAEIYDPATGAFTTTGNMRTARYKIRDAVVPLRDGRILVAGGAPRVEVYDPATGLFGLVEGDVGVTRFYSTATLLASGEVLIVGGYLDGKRGTMYADRVAWLYRPPPEARK